MFSRCAYFSAYITQSPTDRPARRGPLFPPSPRDVNRTQLVRPKNRLIILALRLPSCILDAPARAYPARINFLRRGTIPSRSYSMHHIVGKCCNTLKVIVRTRARRKIARFGACTILCGRRNIPPSITAATVIRAGKIQHEGTLCTSPSVRPACANLSVQRERERKRERRNNRPFTPLKYQPRHYRESRSTTPRSRFALSLLILLRV